MNNKLFYNYIYKITILVYFLLSNFLNAQLCGTGNCGGTIPYSNFGFNSNNNSKTIEYDNFVSGFHTTSIRTGEGKFQIWGENAMADGASSSYIPMDINTTNFRNLTGTPLKMTIASDDLDNQNILLTSTGLFAWGYNIVFPASIAPSRIFLKLTINGKADGLPIGVLPEDVKMLTASGGTISLLTCNGEVWMFSNNANTLGSGSSSTNNRWNRVEKHTGELLKNIVTVRVQKYTALALDIDGNMWTWGQNTYKGDGSNRSSHNRAVEVIKPKTEGVIKMIGLTSFRESSILNIPSIYVLYSDGNLYSLGYNNSNQLGDWTDNERLTWVQPKYNSPTGQSMNNIKWISPNEHDGSNPSINVITNNAVVYNWGNNDFSMLGRTGLITNPGIPGGLTTRDRILSVNTGGHTTMAIRLNDDKLGYVGHYINGSTGNGSTVTNVITNFQWINTRLDICGLTQPFVVNVQGCENNINLNTSITNITPIDAVLKFFNTEHPYNGIEIIDPTRVRSGTYYAFYYYNLSNSYSLPSSPILATGNICRTDCTKPGIIGSPSASSVGITTKIVSNQSGWPTNVPNGYLVLDSSKKGFVINHMTTIQRNNLTPLEGMIIYNTDLKCLQLFRGLTPNIKKDRAGWNCIIKGCNEEL